MRSNPVGAVRRGSAFSSTGMVPRLRCAGSKAASRCRDRHSCVKRSQRHDHLARPSNSSGIFDFFSTTTGMDSGTDGMGCARWGSTFAHRAIAASDAARPLAVLDQSAVTFFFFPGGPISFNSQTYFDLWPSRSARATAGPTPQPPSRVGMSSGEFGREIVTSGSLACLRPRVESANPRAQLRM